MRRVAKCYNLAGLACQLHLAVRERDFETVQRLLQSSHPVDQRDECGSTPLHIAAWQGEDVIAQVLLKHGADANSQRGDGATPLDLVELRARGADDMPPKGLCIETGAGKFRNVAALLRDATLGHDKVLLCRLDSSAGSTRFVCSSFAGVEVASLCVDPARQTLRGTQEILARHLEMSQARVRLVLPGATRLPTEVENRMSLAELFGTLHSNTEEVDLVSVAHPRFESMTSTNRESIDEKECLVLNGLSCSSAASASTCATESDLACHQQDLKTSPQMGINSVSGLFDPFEGEALDTDCPLETARVLPVAG